MDQIGSLGCNLLWEAVGKQAFWWRHLAKRNRPWGEGLVVTEGTAQTPQA